MGTLKMGMEDTELPGRDKTTKRLYCKRSLLSAEQRRASCIRFDDTSLLIEREIPDRGEVIKVGVLAVLRGRFQLRLSQRLILHFQLYLMKIAFVNELLDIGGWLTPTDVFHRQGVFRLFPEVIKTLICCGYFFRHGSAGISSEKGGISISACFLSPSFFPAGFRAFRSYF